MAKLTRKEYDRLKKKYEMRYNWVAKYKDGYVFVYEQKPVKMEDYWYSSDFKTEVDGIKLDFMSFEDEEPYNIKELIDEFEEAYFIEVTLSGESVRYSPEDAHSLFTQLAEAFK